MTLIDGEYFPVFVGVLLVLLSLIGFRLTSAAQPLRLRLASKSEELIASRDLPAHVKEHVRALADDAFGMRWQLIAAIFAIPVIAVVFVVRNRWIRKSIEQLQIKDAALQKDFDEVYKLHRTLTRANHPFLFSLVELEMIVFMTPAILLRATVKGMMPDSDDREILSVIEDRHVGFLSLQRAAANNR